mmetsp:Transcript_16558/g.28169  ORF Transcript_16558/g.28169 Transcript_16558/m.28169 type:complete len:152 (+) Transcript_16558:119-574(+)
MANIIEVLDNMQGAPGLRTPLVDSEGFPRDDVDLFEARKLRNQHACLQTDHQNLMKELEKAMYALQQVYQSMGLKDEKEDKPKGGDQIAQNTASAPVDAEMAGSKGQEEKIPFVWIHDVAKGSPAEQDGFKIGDAICRFGGVTHKMGDTAM